MGKEKLPYRRASDLTKLYSMQLLSNKTHEDGTWVCGMLFFEQTVELDFIRTLVKERLLTIPRFRSKYIFKKWKKGYQEIPVEEIDLDYHVKLVDKEYSVREIQDEWVGNIYKHFEFDPNKPLWQLTYFPKLEDGRSVLLTVISHVIGDGVAQIEVLYRLLDEEQKKDVASLRPPEKRAKPRNVFGPLNKTRIFIGGVFATFTSIFGSPDSRNPLTRSNVKVSGPKKTAFTDVIPLEKIKDIKAKFQDSTVNDILVTLLTLTLHSYFETFDEGKEILAGKKKKIRAGFPINVRRIGEDAFRDGSPHNHVALGLLKFPLKFKNRIDLVWKVKRMLDRIKLSPEPLVQHQVARVLLRILPEKVSLALFTDFAAQTTAMLSNVAGPSSPAKLGGHEVQDMQFLISAPIGFYLGLLSYNGKVSCGICLDETTSANAQELAKHWKPEFEKFYEEVMKHEGTIKRERNFLDIL